MFYIFYFCKQNIISRLLQKQTGMKKITNIRKRKVALLAAFSVLTFMGMDAQTRSDNVLISSSDQSVSGQTYSTTTTDQSAVKATDGTLTISKCKLYNSADASSTDNASFLGTNAVMLSYGSNKSPVIKSSLNYVAGSGRGTNGIFAYGTGSITTTSDTIYQTGGNSRAIMAAGGGTINVFNDVATTVDGSSSVIATDRGGGTINITGGTYTANGSNSAGIYSTGTITADGANFISNGGEVYVIEGSNNITVKNCIATSNKSKWGVLLYQSFSGDAQGSTGTITLTGGSLTYNGTIGGMFYNTNSTAYIYLNGITLTNKCDTLVRSLKGGWGNNATASNGGTTYIIAKGQAMSGMIYADANSKDYITLSEGSSYTNASINPDNVAKLVTLTMDENSSLSLAADCHINGAVSIAGLTSGQTVSNITGNNHNIFYSTTGSPALNGAIYSLTGGGYLCPEGTDTGIGEVTTSTDIPAEVTIYNLCGQVVLHTTEGSISTAKNAAILSSSSLPKGVYVAKADTNSGRITMKLVKR